MPVAAALPTFTTTHTPETQAELAQVVAQAFAAAAPLYPIGGGTSLNFGLPPKQPGAGLSLAKLNRIIDYPARDLTITVEAGVTLRQLAEALAAEGQELPLDVPQAGEATVGGVVATNWNGPRRFGWGSVRDYVIGITAVDGRGAVFSGGGRVVKNVAGYDFCKLLTGSLGTLGVITQLTFKLRPKAHARQWLGSAVGSAAQADQVLTALSQAPVTPHAVELLAGPAWSSQPWCSQAGFGIAVLLEGTEPEVRWMVDRLTQDWRGQQLAAAEISEADLWLALVEFPAGDSPLTLQASLVASGVVPMAAALRELDPQVSLLAHAGSGVVVARFSQLPAAGASKALLNTLQPLAAKHQGHVVVLSAGPGVETTRQVVWGSVDAAGAVMLEIKRQFDPKNILNPGRFVFA